MIVALLRGRKAFPMTTDRAPRTGDRALVALFDDEAVTAREELAVTGWRPVLPVTEHAVGTAPAGAQVPTPDIPLSPTIH